MDKQQAIAYIEQMLDQDCTREEIVLGLVEQLRAPEIMVAKFVAQTEIEYRKSKPLPLPTPIPPQPVKLPPWLEEMTIGSQPQQVTNQPVEPQPDWMQRLAEGTVIADSAAAVTVIEPLPEWVQPASKPAVSSPYEPAPTTPSWEEDAHDFVINQLQYGRLHSQIADELADRAGIPLNRAQSIVTGIAAQVESKPLKKITNTTEATDFVLAEHAGGRSILEIAIELATRTSEPQNLTEKFVALTISKYEKTKAQEKPLASFEKPNSDLNNPALVKYVVSELTKNRKRSDIVMTICERTGAHWSDAQRFVGQITAEQHTTINARKNRLIIPMCIGAIILGFVFTIGTAYPMLYLITGRREEFYSMVSSMGSIGDYINAAPYIFGTGIVLIAGGIIGLVTAMQSQME
jgi:hypothetical protein